MNIVFVHGWSVKHTDTYGDLPQWLSQQSPKYNIKNIFLGKYISFVDAVTLDDIARAFDQALRDALGADLHNGVACIAHSMGGPVVRLWMKLFYEKNLSQCPIKHLIMLAPASHGSALAQLGKGVLSRLKSLAAGIEPGVRVLDWLELGSEQSWSLNASWLDLDCVAAGVYLFVLTGQSIDTSFYDHLNSYTGEPGSDGVVRVAAANLNYRLLRLHQTDKSLVVDTSQRAKRCAFGVLPGLAHSGDNMGIIRSVKLNSAKSHATAKWVLRCLQVNSQSEYDALCDELDTLSVKTQKEERVRIEEKRVGTRKYTTSRYSMLVFRFIDDRGDTLTDYDLFITGGPNYSKDELPSGFFVDRQRNKRNMGKLTYYLDYDVLRRGLNQAAMEGRIGLSVTARPEQGGEALAYYRPLEYRSDEGAISTLLAPNETMMVEIKLQRCVDARVFRVESKLTPSKIETKPTGRVAR
jgi:pimeloyl-ACP methyl ester carboxylesterase